MPKHQEPFHPCVNEIRSLLEKNHIQYEFLEHEPVRTSLEAAQVRPDKYTLSQGAKALIVRIKENGGHKYFAMFVIPGDRKFNYPKTKELFQAKDIRFATELEVCELTHAIKLGGLPPFGNLFGLKVFMDKKVLDNEQMIFNAGDKRVSIVLATKDYQKLVDPQLVDMT